MMNVPDVLRRRARQLLDHAEIALKSNGKEHLLQEALWLVQQAERIETEQSAESLTGER
jgi:hypothetical protein